MYRLFFIAKNNMKKQKGDMITFFLMTFLASFMIFICINLLTGTFRVCNTNKEIINGADILLLKGQNEISTFKLKEIIQGNENVKNYEQTKFLTATMKHRKKGKTRWTDYNFAVSSYDDEREIQKASIDMSSFSGNDIVLPISLSTAYKIGDTIILKIGDNTYDFRVAAFNEDYIWSSPMNMGTYWCYISEKMYNQIEFECSSYAVPYYIIKLQMSDQALKNNVSDDNEADAIYSEYNLWVQNYRSTHPEFYDDLSNFFACSMMMMAGMILPFLFIAIILVFALIILTIALVVIDFSIKNFIMDNMKNTGIMEAGGYTVKEMMLILLVQLLSVSFAGSLTGALLGALLQKKIGFIMLYLIGLSWNQNPDMVVFAGTILGICLIIAVFTLFLGREYKKTSVLDALRGGINTHNYKKNVFPFDKSALPVFLTLALKETFGKFKSQIGVILIMAVLSFSAAMGFGIYENMGKDIDALLRISGLEINDADFSGDMNMYETVKSFECVDQLHYEKWLGLEFVSGKKVKTITTRAISDTSVMRPEMMVEGRWPKYENEIALGSNAAANLGKKVGDTIIVRNGEEEASYLITGIMQTFNNMGMMAYMTTDAYERVGSLPSDVSVLLNLKKGYVFSDLEKEFKDIYPDVELNDEYASTSGLFTLLKTSIAAIMVIIMMVTAFIVALAEALLIRTRITKEWRNLGVNKALGFTSNQLIAQIMLSNIPAIVIGIVLGLILVSLFGNKVVLLMFMIFGFRKVKFALSPIAYIGVVLVIFGVAMLVSFINGSRIKKLEPVKMITEE